MRPFAFRDEWILPGRPDEAWARLEMPEAVLAGWSHVVAHRFNPAPPVGVGTRVDLELRTPYGTRLRFATRVTEAKPPSRLAFRSVGDLAGDGEVVIRAHKQGLRVAFRWDVTPTTRSARLLAALPGGRRLLRQAHARVMDAAIRSFQRSLAGG